MSDSFKCTNCTGGYIQDTGFAKCGCCDTSGNVTPETVGSLNTRAVFSEMDTRLLRASVASLVEACKPFADLGTELLHPICVGEMSADDEIALGVGITVGNLWDISKALAAFRDEKQREAKS